MFLDALDVARHEKQALNHSQVAKINRNLKEALDHNRKNACPVLPSLGETGPDAEMVSICVAWKETYIFLQLSIWHSVKVCVALGDIPNLKKTLSIAQGVCVNNSPFPIYRGCLPGFNFFTVCQIFGNDLMDATSHSFLEPCSFARAHAARTALGKWRSFSSRVSVAFKTRCISFTHGCRL